MTIPARQRRWAPTRAVLSAVIGLASAASEMFGAEVHVLRFRTDVVYSEPPQCLRVGWRDELIFHNASGTPQTVRNLAATAGAASPPGAIVVPPGRTVSTAAGESLNELGGDPFGFTIVVNRLEVPEGVTIASRADVYGPPVGCGNPPAINIDSHGSLALPVVRSLTPANAPQVHLGSDLGIRTRRTNVLLYNAGSAPATARVDHYAACNDSLIESRQIAIGARTVAQIGGLTDDPGRIVCFSSDRAPLTARYVVVTVDQPSFSQVMTISNDFRIPTIGVTSASPP